MPIDEKAPAEWNEADLAELIGRRETPEREFKETLSLDTEGQKKEVEHDVQGLANAGNGFLIYGVREEAQPDGSKVAVELTPLADGGLYEQLNNVLDGRGDPRVPFALYAIDAAAGGIYLVVEISGRRRPHMANDGRYYLRRNLLVRQMTEAEVAEAYRERFVREAVLEQTSSHAAPGEDVAARIRHGLTPTELALYTDETGNLISPGWLSVASYPVPLQPGLLDPVAFNAWSFHEINMDDRWREVEHPLRHFTFERTLNGFHAQLPPGDVTFPRYVYELSPDGLFQFGYLLDSTFRGDPQPRSIPSHAVAFYVHDSLLLFARIYRMAGYDGQVRAEARVDGVRGYPLGVDPARAPFRRDVTDDSIAAEPWEGTVAELEERGAQTVAYDLMRRIFLSAQAGEPYFFDQAGNYIG